MPNVESSCCRPSRAASSLAACASSQAPIPASHDILSSSMTHQSCEMGVQAGGGALCGGASPSRLQPCTPPPYWQAVPSSAMEAPPCETREAPPKPCSTLPARLRVSRRPTTVLHSDRAVEASTVRCGQRLQRSTPGRPAGGPASAGGWQGELGCAAGPRSPMAASACPQSCCCTLQWCLQGAAAGAGCCWVRAAARRRRAPPGARRHEPPAADCAAHLRVQ